ncbi:MAG: transposase family protein [Dysgonamonadaceae bacterium]|jgi:hypothetical protein|nr:transposase family protein [Dysgonamonadaceae bacterium]
MQTRISYFTELTDPRVDRTKEHLMEDIIFITVAAVICGAETWLLSLSKYGMILRITVNLKQPG